MVGALPVSIPVDAGERADRLSVPPRWRGRSARDAIVYVEYVFIQIRHRLLDGVLGELARNLRRICNAIGNQPGIFTSELMKKTDIRDPEFSALTKLLETEDKIHIERGLGRNGRAIGYWLKGDEDA